MLSISIAINGNKKSEATIDELRNNLTEKMSELSRINEMIVEKEEEIDLIIKKGREFYFFISETSNPEDAAELKEKVSEFQKILKKVGWDKENIKKFLINKGLNDEKNNELTRIESFLIRYNVEYYFLKKLTASYEKCLLEFLEIELKIESLLNPQ